MQLHNERQKGYQFSIINRDTMSRHRDEQASGNVYVLDRVEGTKRHRKQQGSALEEETAWTQFRFRWCT